jgi:outer membrane protein OmpA-like peptidoglycan-associated protein
MDGLAALAPITLTREPRGMVITIPARGLFVFDEPRLSDRAEGRLGPVAEALSQQRDHRILVEDHSAVLGTSRPELSQARAEAVRHFFVSRGVPSDRLEAIGDERPPPTAGPPVHDPRVEIVVESVGPR